MQNSIQQNTPIFRQVTRFTKLKDKLIYAFLFFVLAFLSACQCVLPTDPAVDATNVIIDQGLSLTLTNGDNGILTGSVLPSDVVDVVIVWSSSDTNAFVIDSNTGAYSAVATNTNGVQVTASAGMVSTNIMITILQPATNVIINSSSQTNAENFTNVLAATVLPSNHTDMLTWSSSATNVLMINSTGPTNAQYNTLTAGESVVTAMAGSVTSSITITVVNIATNIVINGGDFTTNNGVTGTLTVTVLPANHTDNPTNWSSSSNILSIDSNGQFTTKAPGSVTVTAMVGNVSNVINVVVNNNATNIAINANDTITITNGHTNTLMATVLPTTHADGAITWTSSTTNVLSIDATNAMYVANSRGTATVTARVGDLSDAITVTVFQQATNISINGADFTTNLGVSGNLNATVLPSDHQETITWASSNANLITINATNGQYTVANNASSNTVVQVLAFAGSLSDSINITIAEPATNVVINQNQGTNAFRIANGSTNSLTATILPANHTDGPVIWTSSNANFLTIDSSGISIASTNTNTNTRLLMVNARVGMVSTNILISIELINPATNITIIGGNRTNNNAVTANIFSAVLPSDHTDGAVSWTSSNTNLLTFITDSGAGRYTTKASGNVMVTASVGQVSDTITITINNNPTNITINGGSFSTNNAVTATLTTTILPTNSSGTVMWTSFATSIVSIVSNTGVYTTKATGTARIVASIGGPSNFIDITVRGAVTNIRINTNDFVSELDATNILTATVLPNNHTNGVVIWSSSDTNKLSVLSTGLNSASYISLAPTPGGTNEISNAVRVTATIATFSNTINVFINNPATNVSFLVNGNPANSVYTSNGFIGSITAIVLPNNHTDVFTWSAGGGHLDFLSNSSSSNTLFYLTESLGKELLSFFTLNLDGSIRLEATFIVNIREPATNVTIGISGSNLITNASGDFLITNLGNNVGQLQANFSPTAGANSDVADWISSSDSILSIQSVDDSQVRLNASSYGTVTVSVVARVGKVSNSVTVYVSPSATIDQTAALTNNRNGRLTLTYVSTNNNEHTNAVVWTASDTNTLTIDSGTGSYLVHGTNNVTVSAFVPSLGYELYPIATRSYTITATSALAFGARNSNLDFTLHSGNSSHLETTAGGNRFYSLNGSGSATNSLSVYTYDLAGNHVNTFNISNSDWSSRAMAYYDGHLYLPDASSDSRTNDLMRAYDTSGNRQTNREFELERYNPSNAMSIGNIRAMTYFDEKFYMIARPHYLVGGENVPAFQVYTTNGQYTNFAANTLLSTIGDIASSEGHIYIFETGKSGGGVFIPDSTRAYTADFVRETNREFEIEADAGSGLFYYGQHLYLVNALNVIAYFIGTN